MWDSATFFGALTPKFYVALTGTSSLISGLILIFEWWYFRKYGTSFIEQVSVWGSACPAAPPAAEECGVVRNPLSLLRGAEYARLWTGARRAPLTYYDMNLSAQEHQAWFGCVGTGPLEEALGRAWREREPRARVAAARDALRIAPDCAAALLLLAEEDAPTVCEAERVLRLAWRAAEAALRTPGGEPAARARDAAVLAHVKRRSAMCLRRLGRLRDSARLFRELARDSPPALATLRTHENLLELLLEQRAFGEAAALLTRLREAGAPRSAATEYTEALLRVRDELAGRGTGADAALAAALEYNPHVAEYLLELRPLALPPEHVVRRGASEALAYAFFHLAHWRAADGALHLLEAAQRAAGGAGRASCAADRELLAGGAAPDAEGGARRGRWRAAAAALCAAALLVVAARRWPGAARRAAALAPRRLRALLSDAPDP